FRDGLRHFQHWSALQAAEAGLTPAQHQLLLAIRGHRSPDMATVGDVAGHLLLRHHSVVGLVDRAVAVGLVERLADPDDHRVVRLRLTPDGERRLASLAALHLEELDRLGPRSAALWAGLSGDGPVPP
ncbi:MAG: MarR family winged helix-turn-helix transcriptional regulator, partial [Actinomycetota bacterium]|nr:MarR family winged helix-turn-helix transcriptional regulator [Actinomycetota bacterium]